MKNTFTQDEVKALIYANDYGFTTMTSSAFDDEPQYWLTLVNMLVNGSLEVKTIKDCLSGEFVIHKVIKLLLGELTEKELYNNEVVNV